VIAAGIDELVEQITIGSMDLHTVEPSLQRIFASRVRIVGRCRASPRSARPAASRKELVPLAILILDERLAARLVLIRNRSKNDQKLIAQTDALTSSQAKFTDHKPARSWSPIGLQIREQQVRAALSTIR
jgi:hypothetical protein